MFKIKDILLEVESENSQWNEMKSKFEIENGNVKLYHYSSTKITNGAISISGSQNLHSRAEYQTWGRSRAFFYAGKTGINADKGVSTQYLYICHIPLAEIYPIAINPNGYKPQPGKVSWESYYEQAADDGYTAFAYYLGGKENVPIIVSFKSLKIDEAYEQSPGGGYKKIGEKFQDYPVGTVKIDGSNWYIIQKDGYVNDLSNTYLSKSKKGGDYQKPFDQYQWKLANLSPEFKEKYRI